MEGEIRNRAVVGHGRWRQPGQPRLQLSALASCPRIPSTAWYLFLQTVNCRFEFVFDTIKGEHLPKPRGDAKARAADVLGWQVKTPAQKFCGK